MTCSQLYGRNTSVFLLAVSCCWLMILFNLEGCNANNYFVEEGNNNGYNEVDEECIDNPCKCFDQADTVASFRETNYGLSVFDTAMKVPSYVVGGRRLHQDHRELGVGALLLGAQALTGAVTGAKGGGTKGGTLGTVGAIIGTTLGLVDFGLSIFGELENTDQQILDELDAINDRLDSIEQSLESGFDNVLKAIAELDIDVAYHVFDEIKIQLSNLEADFGSFVASRKSTGQQERDFYELSFQAECVQPDKSPLELFRHMYGYVCSNNDGSCNLIDNGSQHSLDLMSKFIKPGNVFGFHNFRENFSVIILSALSRAMVMHIVCLNGINDETKCEDTIWNDQINQMAEALKGAATILDNIEASIRNHPFEIRPAFYPDRCLEMEEEYGFVYVRKCTGKSNQKWYMNAYGLISTKMSWYFCIGVAGGQLWMDECWGDKPQVWRAYGNTIQIVDDEFASPHCAATAEQDGIRNEWWLPGLLRPCDSGDVKQMWIK